MKIAGFIVIAFIMIIALLTAAATGDKNKRVSNTMAFITAACIITLVYLINS
ncbi:hypothetical protein [Paenibacillus camelliae]|uniref:hypothetical protein n=1 Tax=Paenibacillus camelliae TaxID=512410 RepID=UPI00203C2AD9|nr:hypothetical protein [Paenibacillus camelliae]MCM3632872.1 hypothetical protein [Paenibacillus camelliae]